MPEDVQSEAEIRPVILDPARGKVLVELVVVDERPAERGGLVVKGTAITEVDYGLVLAVSSEGAAGRDPRLKAGAVVVFGKHAGFTAEGEHTMTIREDDVMHFVTGGYVTPKSDLERNFEARAELLVPDRRIAAPHGVNPDRRLVTL